MRNEKSFTGSLTKKSGRYYTVIYYYDSAGKRRSVTRATGIVVEAGNKRKSAQAEREARKALQEALRAFEIPDKKPDGETSFSDYAKLWLSRKEGRITESTYAGYQYALADVCEFFDKHPRRLKEVDESVLEEYVRWEQDRRRTDYIPAKGEKKKRTKAIDGAGVNNTIYIGLRLSSLCYRWQGAKG